MNNDYVSVDCTQKAPGADSGPGRQVCQELDYLSILVGELREDLTRLYDKIDPVLAPEPDTKSLAGAELASPPRCPVAVRLAAQREELSLILRSIREITGRVAV